MAWSLMCPDTDTHCIQVVRTSKRIWHHSVPLLVIGLRIAHALSQLAVSPPGSVDSASAGTCLDSSSSFRSASTASCSSWCA